MADTIGIFQANSDKVLVESLADVLIDCVEGGVSVGFMLPLPRSKAIAFWQSAMASAARGERIVVVAEDLNSKNIVGTVQVILDMPDNQPHRADVAKAREAGKSLLVVDTVTSSDAKRLYLRLGWQRCGEIPDYAFWPQGELCSTTVFYKSLQH